MTKHVNAARNLMGEKIPHHNFVNAVSDVFHAILTSQAGEVVVFIGPSRVGKSSALGEVGRLLVGEPEQFPEDQMPLVRLRAHNKNSEGVFTPRTFFAEALKAVRHPIYGVDDPDDKWGIKRLRLIERTQVGTLETAFENAVEVLKTKYIFIDESQHFQYAKGKEKAAAAILDSWKCFAEAHGVIIVLGGAYPLLNIIELSPHLLGRHDPIHFPRYRSDSIPDIRQYHSILKAIDPHVTLAPGVSSLCDWDFELMRDSFGCVGLTRRRIFKMQGRAASRGLEHLTKALLSETAMPRSQHEVIGRELMAGEDKLARTAECSAGEASTMPAAVAGGPAAGGEPKQQAPRSKKRNSRPYESKPRNHPRNGRI